MKMFGLIIATVLSLVSAASAGPVFFGTFALVGVIDYPAAVATVLVFSGIMSAGLCALIAVFVFGASLTGASDHELRFGIGVPIALAGVALMLNGLWLPHDLATTIGLVIGMPMTVVGTIQCIERIDTLLKGYQVVETVR